MVHGMVFVYCPTRPGQPDQPRLASLMSLIEPGLYDHAIKVYFNNRQMIGYDIV